MLIGVLVQIKFKIVILFFILKSMNVDVVVQSDIKNKYWYLAN